MPKYSIIVTVYNTEKYIEKCLNSILNQTYNNFELIIINDGSTDNSLNIINKVCLNDKRVRIINQENKGVSYTRNYGISISLGEYFLFVDSDDYIDKKLLKHLSKINSDVIRYQFATLSEDGKQICKYKEKEFYNLKGEDAFEIISKYKLVDLACGYVFKKEYFKRNNFSFEINKLHEDFGLIPLTILLASSVTSINYIGYYYVQRQGSTMNTNSYLKEVNKSYDALFHYKKIKRLLSSKEYENINKKTLLSFMANSVIVKLKYLNKKDKKKYLTELKKINVYEDILDDTLIRKIKKIFMKINIKLYLKVIK